jgi:hypothetical protein
MSILVREFILIQFIPCYAAYSWPMDDNSHQYSPFKLNTWAKYKAGPEVETVYPPDVSFSTSDLSTICFNSFPERQDADLLEDMYFSFTLRNNSPDIKLSSPTPPYGSAGLFHGTCVFRQEYDSLSKRRFNQKSLVVVSNQEFPAFFVNVLRVIVTGATIGDITRLEAACSQIEGWPPPRIRKQDLPFLGGIISLEM